MEVSAAGLVVDNRRQSLGSTLSSSSHPVSSSSLKMPTSSSSSSSLSSLSTTLVSSQGDSTTKFLGLDSTFATFGLGSKPNSLSSRISGSLEGKNSPRNPKNSRNPQQSPQQQQLPVRPPRVIAETLQQQGRLLLVALLENFCALYHKEPSQNRRLFTLLCRRLCAMGVLEAVDFVDETVHVRSVYKRAFRELVVETMRAMNGGGGGGGGEGPRLLREKEETAIDSSSSLDIGVPSLEMSILPSNEDSKSSNDTQTTDPDSSTTPSFEEFLGREVSRYAEDFCELAVLGRGGFGRVFKVQNRVDTRLYAIKKINFASIYSSRFQRIMREVRALANLEHPNIVRYHSSWIEEATSLIQPVKDHCEWDTGSHLMNITITEEGNSTTDHVDRAGHLLIMYIQMELCQYTLHDLLEHRNQIYFGENSSLDLQPALPKDLLVRGGEGDKAQIDYLATIRIFKGIVKGLAHIHAQGMIHRDLKPQNIFFTDETFCPKIGDFGLVSESRQLVMAGKVDDATDAAADDDEKEGWRNGKSPQNMTCGLGTELYASPEQISGTLDYDCKADIYSLGIVCFELFHPFRTQMERVRVLGELKKNKRFPPDFLLNYPKETALIWSCLASDPAKRPTAAEILDLEILVKHDHAESRYEALLESYHVVMAALMAERSENERLRAEAERQASELAALKERLERVEGLIEDLAGDEVEERIADLAPSR